MLTSIASKLCKTLFMPSLVATFCLSLWLAEVAHAQPPRQGQNQQNPAGAGADRGKGEPVSGWYIAPIPGLAILILVGAVVLAIFFQLVGLLLPCSLTCVPLTLLNLL